VSYLLDTNVVSEIRKKKPDRNVARWFESVGRNDLFLSVLVLGEVRQGIERLRRRDPARAASYERWIEELATAYGDRILAIDAAVAQAWGPLNVPDPLPVVDVLMAATAIVHSLTLVTRNVADVARTRVQMLNPFEPASRG
jgi:predicted nucleic acid-binding protein